MSLQICLQSWQRVFWALSVELTLKTKPRDSLLAIVSGLSAQEGLETIDPPADWMPWEDPVPCSMGLWTGADVGRSEVEGS